MVRTRAPFTPLPQGVAAAHYGFADPVVLVRAPFRISFAYAGPDRAWVNSWGPRDQLPDAVRVSVRDWPSDQGLAASTAAPLKVTAKGAAAPPAGQQGLPGAVAQPPSTDQTVPQPQ